MAKEFSRHIESDLIKELLKTPLWINKLERDCKERKVFLAIRPDYISFYYKGGGLFKFDKNRFQTNVAYTALLKNYKDDYIHESYLPKVKTISNFVEGYTGIKKNCEQYSKNTEDEGVSVIYHTFPYNLEESDVVVLDIQAAFIDTQEDDKKKKQNRTDILLFHKRLRELLFIEAKKYDNDEIRAKNKAPLVIEQLQRYRATINKQGKDILSAYKEYTDTLKEIFSDLSLSDPQKIEKNVGLLIFGFDKDQRDGRLNDQIITNPVFNDIPFYCIGNIKDIKAETFWEEIKKKIK